MNTIVLSTSYTPPLYYLYLIRKFPDVRVEFHENYQKQSFRNRMYVLSSGGVQILTVPVEHANRKPIGEVKISYREPWQRNHIKTLRTCYNNAPYYLYYGDLIENTISTNFTYLFELNAQLLHDLCGAFKLTIPEETSGWAPAINPEYDFRNKIRTGKECTLKAPDYRALFPLQTQNVGLLTSLDLLFNNGPDGSSMLDKFSLI
jgi:hypothetical protein